MDVRQQVGYLQVLRCLCGPPADNSVSWLLCFTMGAVYVLLCSEMSQNPLASEIVSKLCLPLAYDHNRLQSASGERACIVYIAHEDNMHVLTFHRAPHVHIRIRIEWRRRR